MTPAVLPYCRADNLTLSETKRAVPVQRQLDVTETDLDVNLWEAQSCAYWVWMAGEVGAAAERPQFSDLPR